MFSIVNRALHSMGTDDESTRAFVDGFATDMVTYLSNSLQGGSSSRSARRSLCREMQCAVAPLYDWGTRCYQPSVTMPFQSSPDDEYRCEYYLLYRDNNNQLLHKGLDTPVEGTFNVSDLTHGIFGDVVIIHITRNTNDSRCVSFSTCRVYNHLKK